MNKLAWLVGALSLSLSGHTQAIFNLNDDGSHYVKLGMTHQVWARYTQTNPGSGLYGSPVDGIFDVTLRRTRLTLGGMLTDKTYFFVQLGQNNFNLRSQKYPGIFFHDAITEYHVRDELHIGAGLTGWSGLLRYASPSVGSIMSLDAPLYQQATNGANDQFLRKLSVYAKGKIGKFSYRAALSNPMSIQNASIFIQPINDEAASFSTEAPKMQYQGYFQYHFFDDESMLNPYSKGTYLGARKILALGAGAIAQPDAMWKLAETTGDTVFQNMTLFGVDLFYESKMDTGNPQSFTAYVAYSLYDFGTNYLRNVGVDNPVNTSSKPEILNGAGNNYPMIGTGSTVYAQFGYLRQLKNEAGTKLQPYIATQISDYDYLDELMVMAEAGINWYIRGRHSEKISANYQSRPVYEWNDVGDQNSVTSRASMAQVQFQLAF